MYSKRYSSGVFELPQWEKDPSDQPIIMFMIQQAGPGRGIKEPVGGFFKTRELNLGEALKSIEFRDIANQTRNKLVKLVRSYISRGIIDLEELA